ncbi:Glycine/D-amino acid oxidase [Novosphingobium sp. CF614]|uniref:NAD(P)/FAD-dependent oxidoreductase n=1 Tax=Novosphingobium sp. CF614 TaxID=1884364 RepID=UPI0008E86EBB|nr:FAD-binding oxidoreductase [Novosphingobium sp. CF614]SFG11623.1 Glycine/D-amino acid oxidase [Novosphingobium sp. CF614]
MKLMSYWLDTVPAFAGGTTAPVGGKADVVIVGAGLTGTSAALTLAKKGASVVVCEADVVGGEASGRNGGMCNNGFAQDYRIMAARFGNEQANQLYRAFDAGVDMVERLVREEDIDCSFARTGKLKLAARPEHYDKLARTQEELARQVDPDTRMVSRAELAGEVGTDRFHGGLIFEKGAGLHVGRFVRGLADAAARRGVQFHEATPVTGIRKTGAGTYEVATRRGKIEAGQVLLASGISSVGPLGWFRRRIIPVGSFLIATEPLPPEQLDRIMPRRRMATDTKNIVNYFRVLPDNRLLFGGRARFAVSDPKSDMKSGAILRESMLDVFPELAGARIDYCWGGMVDMTRDRLPRAGQRKDGLYYSMGYSGHGTQMATYMGTVMAEVMDGNVDLNPWRDFDWPAIPGHFGKPWFLPIVGAYYRLQDRLK